MATGNGGNGNGNGDDYDPYDGDGNLKGDLVAVAFGSDEGMQPSENAAEQLTQAQHCARCGKMLVPPFTQERYVYGTYDTASGEEKIDSYGFACTDCQAEEPDYDWYD